MTNKELTEYCTLMGINVESKNVSKPTKAELLLAISEYEAAIPKTSVATDDEIDAEIAKMELEAGIIPSATDNVTTPAIINLTPEEIEEQKRKDKARSRLKKKRENQFKVRVIINSNDPNQNRLSTQAEYVTWGNSTGHYTDIFVVGKPWMIRKGALNNLKNKKIIKSITNDEGVVVKQETIPAYIIQELPLPTKEELAIIAKRQIIRENSTRDLD